MAGVRGGAAMRQLQALFSVGTFGGLTDGELLDRFAAGRGEAGELAFAVLVERHGPMVLRVCRAALGDEDDAEDAFQATFLVLARRCRSLRVVDSLGPWLHGVARRVASAARAAAGRRRRHERQAAEYAIRRTAGEARDLDLERLLHEEIGRLPERCRVPVVLCLVEGLTHEQAARHLGWPVGTVKSRLADGRERLRGRLIRRGLAPSAALAGATLATRSARAAMSASLVAATARAAMGRSIAGAVPATVTAMAAKFQRRTIMIRLCLLTVSALTLGAIGLAPGGTEEPPLSGLKFTFVDLQPNANHRLADALGSLEGNNLAGVPRGPQNLQGTWFQIGEKLIRVRGQRSPEPPAAVRGIAIAARFDALHILHSTMFGNAFGANDGTTIGAYVVHYGDGTEERIPIVYGEDVRDWWRSSDSAAPSRAKVAWAGTNEAAGTGDEIRLFCSEWKNPHPGKTVMTIDFETKDTACAPFLVAMTLERRLHSRD